MLGMTIGVGLRPLITRPGIVEFWRGAAVDRAFDDTSDGWADTLNKADILDDASRTPVIHQQIRNNERDIDLVASFEINGPKAKDILVRELKGDLLSRSWAFREKMVTSLFRQIINVPTLLLNDTYRLLAPHSSGLPMFFMVALPVYFGALVCC